MTTKTKPLVKTKSAKFRKWGILCSRMTASYFLMIHTPWRVYQFSFYTVKVVN